MCSTFCRCSNYVRTGNTRRPDLLLCAWNQACLNETAKIVHESMLITQPKRKEELSCDLEEPAGVIDEFFDAVVFVGDVVEPIAH